jgi:hypothetical protein
MTFRSFPNTFHNDKWVVTFSNIPTVSDLSDMRYYDNYIKSVNLPEYTMGEILSDGPMGFRIRHPLGGMKKNMDLNPLNIEFKLSEDLFNYYNLFEWMKQLKYGEIDPNHNDFFRKYSIKTIVLSILDNQKRPVVNFKFTEALLTAISPLSLVMGASEELTFTCTFTYEEIEYEVMNPMVGSSNPTTPTIVDPCATSGVSITTSADWM